MSGRKPIDDDITHTQVDADFPTDTLSPDDAKRVLVVAYSPDSALIGKQIELTGELEVGRKPGAHGVAVDDRKMSRAHVRIGRSQGIWWATDLESRNGTRVNGQSVARAKLQVGSVVRTGETVAVFCAPGRPLRTVPGADLVGSSTALAAVVERADRVAASGLAVHVVGETGTGKELIARRLHGESRRGGAFVAVNCAAIAENLADSALFGHVKGAFTGADRASAGFFGSADRGTLFLDEIGELPAALQPKLLRALDSGEYVPVGSSTGRTSDVRVVSATHARLGERVAAGTFRADLFARLAGVVIETPPLRDRREDIARIAFAMCAELQVEARWDGAFVEAMLCHPWPMNVRELRQTIHRVAVVNPEGPWSVGMLAAELVELPASDAVPAAKTQGNTPPRDRVVGALRRHRGNVAQTAAALGTNRRQLYRWLERLNIDPASFREV